MKRNNRLLLIFSICLAVSAYAETTFYDAYQAGMQLEIAGKWQEARDRFLEAASLHPAPARRVRTYGLNFLVGYDPYIHIAHCESELGLYEEAIRHLEMSHKAGVTPERNLLDLRKRLAVQLEKIAKTAPPPSATIPETAPAAIKTKEMPQPATLNAESDPAGAFVFVDGEQRGLTPLRIPLPPGEHHVAYQLQGFEPGQETINLDAGETETVKIALTARPPLHDASIDQPQTSKTMTQASINNTPEGSPPSLEEKTEPETTAPEDPSTMKPRQKKGSRLSATDPSKPLRTRISRSLLLLLLAAAVVGLLLLFRKGRATLEIPTDAAIPKGEKKIPIPQDSPTHDLRLHFDSTARVPTPVHGTIPEEIKLQARDLPEGTSKTFDGYELIGVLGRGGMGTTFVAKRTRDGLPVALKVPHDHLLDSPEFIQRFLREGSLGATLHHPNIIRIHEAGKAGSKPFIAMELLQGQTLESVLRVKDHLTVREALEVSRDVALALDYARFKGIVHRDLKPENIMMMDRGGLKVLDYGIAHLMNSPGLTTSGTYLGTPFYSSPESTGSGVVDQQSDLYSLGIVLYRCLTGALPFSSDNPLVVLDMHRSQALPLFPAESGIPDSVFQLVRKLTEKNKSGRFENAESFLVELNRILNELEP